MFFVENVLTINAEVARDGSAAKTYKVSKLLKMNGCRSAQCKIVKVFKNVLQC